MSPWAEMMTSLLGRPVVVTLSVEPEVTVAGLLHSFGDDGEVCVREEDGTYRWAWPNLHIREEAA